MHPDRNPQGLVPSGFLRLGLDERGDRDAGTKTQNGRRGAPQDVDWRMAEPLRRCSARGLRGLIRSFVMTGEVRLFGKGALNPPGAAAMAAWAAASNSDLGPADDGQVGAVRPKSVCWPNWRRPEMCPGFTGCRKCRQGRKDGHGSSKPWPVEDGQGRRV